MNFTAYVLFTDEAIFDRDGIFNLHNAHMWTEENPHGLRNQAAQNRFPLNVWPGFVGNCLTGPYLLLSHMTYTKYKIFLEEDLR